MKIGDKVIAMVDGIDVTRGKIYKIIEVGDLLIKIIDDRGDSQWVKSINYELVEILKVGDKIRIEHVYEGSVYEDDVKEGCIYTVNNIEEQGFDFTDGEYDFYCFFENDEDFEYELVDEEEILKECKEFEEQLKKKEEIKLKAKEEAKEYMEEFDEQTDAVSKVVKTATVNTDELVAQLKEREEKNDKVNHPSHYQTAGGIEVIEYIASLLGDNVKYYYLGNVIKYVSRFDKKNGVEDLEKARFYLNKMIEMEEK